MRSLLASSRIVFDVTDLLAYYSEYAHVSGIQRVVGRLLATCYAQRELNIRIVVRGDNADSMYELDKAIFAQLAVPERRLAAIFELKRVKEDLEDYRLLQRLKNAPWKALRKRYRPIWRRAEELSTLPLSPFTFNVGDELILAGAYWIVEEALMLPKPPAL